MPSEFEIVVFFAMPVSIRRSYIKESNSSISESPVEKISTMLE